MKKIKNLKQHIDGNVQQPLNFKLLKEIKISNYQLPFKIESKVYQCDYYFRENYNKPLNIV